MQIAFIEEEIKYDGSQLASHFAYRRLGLLGDSCVAFIGPCEVPLTAMVDLEDVRKQAPIFSPRMLHFIWEGFAPDWPAGIYWQRLMIVQVQEQLQRLGVGALNRQGDDLWIGDKKLTVSIATRSPLSSLIHLGINVLTEGAPVPAIGLQELKIEPEKFAKDCLENFRREYQGILKAAWKVRPVS